MPHQCLSCGEAFADGSTDLLKGCPRCEGTRFFYTQEPLGAEERQELKSQTDENVHSMLKELLDSGEKRNLGDDIWSKDAWEKWIRLESGDDGELSIQDLEDFVEGGHDLDDGDEPSPPKPTLQVRLEDVEEVEAPEPTEVEPPEPAPVKEPARPSTLNIVEPGQYEIDVERLMEDSPVIVERDGSYVIHLPSVFERSGKRR